MNYDYTDIEAYAKKEGIYLLPDKLDEFDQMARAHSFSQAQVSVAMQIHIKHISWIFNPKNFPLKMRIGLALHFLFGRKK